MICETMQEFEEFCQAHFAEHPHADAEHAEQRIQQYLDLVRNRFHEGVVVVHQAAIEQMQALAVAHELQDDGSAIYAALCPEHLIYRVRVEGVLL